jgi:uncharacterized protein (TIGR00730 family)
MATIGVFCASSRSVGADQLELGRAVGAALAKRGHTLVWGGGRAGIMGTVAEGARAAGGRTIGVIPQVLVDREIADTQADELMVTDGMAARKIVLIARAEAFLILPGGLGTLDELFEVWTTATLGLHAKPIILLDADGFYADLISWISGLVERGFVGSDSVDLVHVARSMDEALDVVERFV